jgi:cytoskeletal protein RodZ
MTEVEAATKIRAKYLRALENEEWDLLPGPTFVKTFLRTYAEYLDLDPRLLVEEYRQRYERPSTQDLTPFGAGRGGANRGRRRQRRPIGPFVVLLAGALALVGALYALGVLWGEPDEKSAPDRAASSTPTPRATASPKKKKSSPRKKRKAAPPARVSVRVTAVRPVFVCLVDASGQQVVDGENLAAGEATGTFRSKRFRANFGNGGARVIVDGERFTVPDTGRPIGFEFRPDKRPKRLKESVRVGLCAT